MTIRCVHHLLVVSPVQVEKEKEALSNELARVQKQIQSSDHILSNQDSEAVKLNRVIQEADEEKNRQEKEYRAILSERDVLRNQLVKRDEELNKLYEKLKVQKSILDRGAAQYEEKRKEIENRKQRVKELKGELEVSNAQISNLPELEQEQSRLEEELLQEQTKVKRLEEELNRPFNVHRWRQLEVSDPERYALIQKVSSLQKRLTDSQSALQEKEKEIEEKEKAYIKLKEVLARQPGSEVDEQAESYQEALKRKNKQLKSINADLENYKHLVDEIKREIQALDDRMKKVNEQYINRKYQAHGESEQNAEYKYENDYYDDSYEDEGPVTEEELQRLLADESTRGSPSRHLSTEATDREDPQYQ